MDTSSKKTSKIEEHKDYWNRRAARGEKIENFRSAHNHKWRYDILLLPLINRLQPTSILEVGFGTLDDYEHIRSNGYIGPYTGVELTDRYLEMGKKRDGIDIIKGDIEALPFKDDSFDLIYARGVVEMQSNFKPAIIECLRVARRYVFLCMLNLSHGETEIRRKDRHGIHYLNQYNLQDIVRFLQPRVCIIKNKRVYTSVIIEV